MYRPGGFDRRECPEPPHLLLQQNRFQILNAQNQQNCTSPVLYKQTGNTNMDQVQGHNTNVNIIQNQGQGCSPSAQIIRCRRMLCQTQEFYYMFPSPRRSSISNHPSGCRTMAQRRLMHQRLDSSNTGNSNQHLMIDNEENYMQNSMLPRNIFNNPHTNLSIDNNAICGKQQLVQEFESSDRSCSQVINGGIGGEQQARLSMSQSRVALSDFINNNSIDIDQSFNGLDDHSYSRKNTDNFSYEDENHTNAAYYTNCQRDSSSERLKVLQTNSASYEGQRFQNSNVCPFQRNQCANSLRIDRNSNGNPTVSTDRSGKQSALNPDVESKLVKQHLRNKIEQQASLNHVVKSKLVKQSTLLQLALRDMINKEKEKEKTHIEAAKNKKNFRIEGSAITMITEAKQPDKTSQTKDKSKHLESVVDKTESNILCSSTSSGESVECMNADKRNNSENEPMEKKNFTISANVPTVESKIIVDNAKMVTRSSRISENQNKATCHQQVNVKSSSECASEGQVRTQTAQSSESEGQVRTQTAQSSESEGQVRTQTAQISESEGQVRTQTAQSAEASYNLALKQWQKQNLCKTKTSHLQKTNTVNQYHQTHQQLKTQNSGRSIEMDSSNTKNCDPSLEALEQNSVRSMNIHSNTKNCDPRLEAQKQNSINSMNIHSSNAKNCNPSLEVQKQNSASSINIHSNTKICDPRLEAQNQNFANSMNIHSKTKNCDPHLEAQKQNSVNSMNIHSNSKNCDPRLEAQKQSSANSVNIQSNTKNFDPRLEARKQSSANSMNIHPNTKNCDPRLEASKQSSARSIYILSNTKNHDPHLEAQKQNSANSMNIHSKTKNRDPRLEACKQNPTISNDSLNTNSFYQNAEICTTNDYGYTHSTPLLHYGYTHSTPLLHYGYTHSTPLLHDRKNVDCNVSLDKLQSINPECPRKNPCRENESSENSCHNRKEVSSKDTGFRQALVDVVKAMFDLRRNKHFKEKIIAGSETDKASNNDKKLDGQNLNQTISAHKGDYELDRQSRNQPDKLSIEEYKLARQTVNQQIKPNKAESKQVAETRNQAKSFETYDNSQNGRVKLINCQRSSNFSTKTNPVLSKTVKNTEVANKRPTSLEATKSSEKSASLEATKSSEKSASLETTKSSEKSASLETSKSIKDKPFSCISNANDRNIFTCVFDTDSTRTSCDNRDDIENDDFMDENKHHEEYRKTSDLLEKSYSCQTPDKLNEKSNSHGTDKISEYGLFSSENSEDDRWLPDKKESVKENYEDGPKKSEDKCLILQKDLRSTSVSDNKERNSDSEGSNNITEKTGVHGNINCKTPSPSKMSPKIQSTGKDFSFLELGYCPLALPLGCYAYEEDADREENNNDSPKRLEFDPDIVATNKHMRKLCDEKYNHDNTEILTPWVIRYLDEIPKPTIRREFLDKMDLELNENETNHHHILQASIASPENNDSGEEDIQTVYRESPLIIPLETHYVKDTIKTHQIRSTLASSLDDTLSDINSIPISDDTPLIIPSDSHYVKDTIKTHQIRSILNCSLDDTLSDLNSIPVSDDECDWSLGESEDDSSTDNYSERVPGDYSERVPGDNSDGEPGESDQNEDKTDSAVEKSTYSKKSLQCEFGPESSDNSPNVNITTGNQVLIDRSNTEGTDYTKNENHGHLLQRGTLLTNIPVDNKAKNSEKDSSLNFKIQNENVLLHKDANFHEKTDNKKEEYYIGVTSMKINSQKEKDEISNIVANSDNLEDVAKGDNLLTEGKTKLSSLLETKVTDAASGSTLSTKKTRTNKRSSPTENQLFQEAMNFLCSGKIKDNNEKIIDCFSNSSIRTRQMSSNIVKDVEQGEARKKKQKKSSSVEKDIVHADNVKKNVARNVKKCGKPSKVKELKEKQKTILDNLKSQKEIISLEKKQEENCENCDGIEETKDNFDPKTKNAELNKEVTNGSRDRNYLIEDIEKQKEDKFDNSFVVMPVNKKSKCSLNRPDISMDVLSSEQKDLPLKRQGISPEESEALTGLLTLGESCKSVETQTLYNTDLKNRTLLNSSCEVKSNTNRSSDDIIQTSELENEIDQRINKLLDDVRGKQLNGDKSGANEKNKGKSKSRGNSLYHKKSRGNSLYHKTEERELNLKDNKKGESEENLEGNKKDKKEENGDVCKRDKELQNLEDDQKDKQVQNEEFDRKDKELQNPDGDQKGVQQDRQEQNLEGNKKNNKQEQNIGCDQKDKQEQISMENEHEKNLKSDISDGLEQSSKEEHDHHPPLPILIAAATENDRSVPIDTTVQSGSTGEQSVTASDHTQSPGSNEYLENSDSDTIPLVVKTVVEEKTPGKWLIPILERLNIDISKGRLVVTKTAQKLCIKTGTLIKSTCSYSSQTSVVQGTEERNTINSPIDEQKSSFHDSDSQNHDDELDIENVNSSITKSIKRKKGQNLSDNSMELRSQGTTNTKKWKKLKDGEDTSVPRITRNRALQVKKKPTINLPNKNGNLIKKKTSGKKVKETVVMCPELNDISMENNINQSKESLCHKKTDSSNKKSKGIKGTKRKLEFDVREDETNENKEDICDNMDENQMITKPPETKKKKIPKCRKMLNKSSTKEEKSTENISPAAELPEQMNNLGDDVVSELDNQKESENGKKQKVKKNIMKKSSKKLLKSLSTPKTKSLKAISGAKSKKKTLANGNKVCFRLVTEPSEQKIVRLKAEALKKLYATKICAYCKQTVPSRQFKHHVKIHHPYRCAKCGLLFSNKVIIISLYYLNICNEVGTCVCA
ncbi:uncharacterized protein LOC134723097 [Mytilus trossulus]|uniref:uncharacterized protein LOC134723097 n=1 Tax=Mytilus trossulus TaxID=6551 RepID=UPI003005D25B